MDQLTYNMATIEKSPFKILLGFLPMNYYYLMVVIE